MANPAEVMHAIEKKISRTCQMFVNAPFVIANAVSTDSPPVMSQYGSLSKASKPLAGEGLLKSFSSQQ